MRHPEKRGLDLRATTAIRRTLLVIAAMVLTLALLLAALAFSLSPVLNSDAFRKLAEDSFRSLSGFPCRIERIRFSYPFDLTVEGISLAGLAAGSSFHLYVDRTRIQSGLAALVRGTADEILVEGVEIDVDVSFEEAAAPRPALEDRPPFEVPDAAWRIRRAILRVSGIRVSSETGSVSLEDLAASWTSTPPGPGIREARLGISLSGVPGQPEDVVLLVRPDSIRVPSGPAVLPDMDLSLLIAFAGLDVPFTGTLSGAAFPLTGTAGAAEAVYVELFSEDLALNEERFNAGFTRGRIRAAGYILLPGRDAGPAAFLEEITASLEGLTAAGRPLATALDSLAMSGSLRFDVDSDTADWTLDVRGRPGNIGIHTEGTLVGVLSGERQAAATVRAGCPDLGRLAAALFEPGPLPGGLTLKGGVHALVALTGPIESLDVTGRMHSSDLEVGSGRNLTMPVRIETLLSGSFRAGAPERFHLRTTRFEIEGVGSPKASLAYGPEGVTGTVAIDSMEAENLVSLLRPLLPADLAAFQWSGTADLSARAQAAALSGSPIRGEFSAAVRDGQFTSEDYQRMGEGIDYEMSGTFHLPPGGSSLDLTLDAALPKGEIVIGEVYGDLSRTRPQFYADLGLDPAGRSLRLHSARLTMDGVGSAGLKGRIVQGQDGLRVQAEIEVGPLSLDELLERILRDGLGDRYPDIKGMTGAGSLEIIADVDADLGAPPGSYRAHGSFSLVEAALTVPSRELSIRKVQMGLPFSLAAGRHRTDRHASDRPAAEPGTITVEGIDFRGLEIPMIHAEMLVAGDRVALQQPMRIDLAGGSVHIDELSGEGLGPGPKKAAATLEIIGLDLAPLAEALAGRTIEGRLNGRFDRLALEDGAWELAGRVKVRIREGELAIEDIHVKAPPSGSPSGTCTVTARSIPLEAVSTGFMEPPIRGTLDGGLSTVMLSEGRLHTEGSLEFQVFDGRIRVSEMGAGGLFGSRPFAELDIDMEEIDLASLTAPMQLGSISGVLQGRIHGLRIQPGFPYATAFEADLRTVRRRGVTQRIDATAVETLSMVGGSSQLGSALSSGLYRYFQSYYYRKMGIRAVLEDGWLDLQGIPRGGREYLIVRAFRMPTLSMPIIILTPSGKIGFNKWLADLMRLGQDR